MATRRQVAELYALGKALMKAAREQLEEEARTEHAKGTRVHWDMDDLSVTASTSHRTLVVQDWPLFLAWLHVEHPEEVVEVPSVLTVRNPAWLTGWREQRAAQVAEGDQDAPPGTKLEEGGAFDGISIKVPTVTAHVFEDWAQRITQDPDKIALLLSTEDLTIPSSAV